MVVNINVWDFLVSKFYLSSTKRLKMKGIYLTEEGKKEIEAKIAELEKVYPEFLKNQLAGTLANRALVNAYKEILSSATILTVEDNWEQITILDQIDSSGTSNLIKIQYPNGVIIKPKE